MRTLIVCHVFAPSVGGIETTTDVLATGLVKHGHGVVVVTRTPNDGSVDDSLYPFAVIRRPSPAMLMRLVSGADVVFHNNPCIRWAWPLLLVRRPWVTVIRMWLPRPRGVNVLGYARYVLKRRIVERADRVVLNGEALRGHLRRVTDVVPNGYRDDVFYEDGAPKSPGQLVAVARLVRHKGVDVAVDALALLVGSGHDVRLDVAGEGPERERLMLQAAQLGVDDRINFLGALSPETLAALLRTAEVTLLPSRAPETFGTTALEAMACGSLVVATDQGGYRFAVGQAGVLVPPDDAPALAGAVAKLLSEPVRAAALRQEGRRHVANFTTARMVDGFHKILNAVVEERRRALP